MTEQITFEQALELVTFMENCEGDWVVQDVRGSVVGNVGLNVVGNVEGSVLGYVGCHVVGNVRGNVGGTINGRQWEYIETPKEKLKRLIEEGADKSQLMEAFNQMEDNDD